MTAPWSFQFPTSQPTTPGPFQPAPSSGDVLQSGIAGLVKALAQHKEQQMQQQQIDQQGQFQNRELDVRRELGLGNIGQQRAELQQKTAEYQHKEAQTAEALRRQAMTGKALKQSFKARGVMGLDDVPDENVVGLVPELEKAGYIGPLTDAERRLTAYKKYQPDITPEVAKEFLGPAPGTTINVDTKGASAYSTGFGGGRAQQALKDIESSRASVGAFDRDERLLGYTKQAITGMGAGAKLQAARVANLLGLQGKFKNDAEATQLLQSEGSRLVGEMVTAGLAGRGNLNPRELEMLQQAAGQDISLEAGTIQALTRIRYKMRIADEEDRAAQLRRDAVAYPDNAPQLTAEADRIEQQLRPRRATLAKMEQEEAKQEQQQSAKNAQRVRHALGDSIP